MDTNTAVAIFTYVLAAGFLGIFAVLIWKMADNTMDLSKMLCEPNGKASLSRFQLLVFTLVIGGLYVILSIENGQLIDVPNGALVLLAISGASFLISKGIGASKPSRSKNK